MLVFHCGQPLCTLDLRIKWPLTTMARDVDRVQVLMSRWARLKFDATEMKRTCKPPPSGGFLMSTPVRQRRGYGTLALGLAALAAAAGGLYWYFNREGALGSTWFRPGSRVKRKSVLIVLDQVMSLHVSGSSWQHILRLLPSYEESQSYVDLYVICPPTVQASYDDPELRKCLSHESRILHCSTREGLVHIAKHIGSDVVILGEEYSWAVEKLRGSLISHPKC